ncbi:KICSTOR complex protein C12orf66 homolog [Lytechinus variegatus]|uniref:KICSTOR complex protein C12orf66 homolog n=1 Tax=Lytechinus variegatus TaxID=7654 RepID=UPI001BB1CA7A|nr:KICSTOR complex protein C12orf66 homolog [Lytechinus variegatus]
MSTNLSSKPELSPDHEEIFIEKYFETLSQLAFDKAKEQLDKEKEASRTSSGTSGGGSWTTLLNALTFLNAAEKSYTSLTFLELKWFARKESTRKGLYTVAMGELRRIEAKCHEVGSLEGHGSLSSRDRLLAHLCEQLSHFIEARQDLMNIYERLCTLGIQKNEVDFVELKCAVEDIRERTSKRFHHPVLVPIRNSFSVELELLFTLMQTECHMSSWRFLPALLCLQDLHAKLDAWGAAFKAKDPKKKLYSLVQVKNSGIPPLFVWLVKMQGSQISKFSLYFHSTLSKQAPPGEMKTHLSNLPIDYYNKIVAFQRKTDAFNISLVLNTQASGINFQGLGYHFPSEMTEPPTGMDSYPAIFSYPNERPTNLWPNIVMLIMTKHEAGSLDSITYECDKISKQPQMMTYFIGHVDRRMNLVVLFESKKSERDSTTNSFIQEMCSLLRGSRLLASLRPGTKS